MSTVYVFRRNLGKVRKYVPTGKELSLGARDREQMWWRFASMIQDKFGEEGATPEEIYNQVTAPIGLTADTTLELLYHAKDGGYLRLG